MSAGEFFDLIRPSAFLVSTLISTWVLAAARKHFPFYQSLLWAIGTLFFPLIVLPLYFVALLLKRRKPAATSSDLHSVLPSNTVKWRYAGVLVYAVVVFSATGLYLYRENETADAHLARATRAKLKGNKAGTISEYKKSLQLEDDPHTHKLLAIELADSGYWTDAISQFRFAEAGGEPDDTIHFHLGSLLDQINHQGEATLEYEKFLSTKTCRQEPVDVRCDATRARLASSK
jgi:hypothetical protein